MKIIVSSTVGVGELANALSVTIDSKFISLKDMSMYTDILKNALGVSQEEVQEEKPTLIQTEWEAAQWRIIKDGLNRHDPTDGAYVLRIWQEEQDTINELKTLLGNMSHA